jgi:hypothetical protein
MDALLVAELKWDKGELLNVVLNRSFYLLCQHNSMNREYFEYLFFTSSFTSMEELRYVSDCRLGISVKVPAIPE